jgi:hypothetical protein
MSSPLLKGAIKATDRFAQMSTSDWTIGATPLRLYYETGSAAVGS